ncbi:MAG: hypothetical protein PHH70_03915 [Candidatus Gracilibacteria bacterium]|nr:hypothetical protein [Candidatus Gracilibacteria bacterium]
MIHTKNDIFTTDNPPISPDIREYAEEAIENSVFSGGNELLIKLRTDIEKGQLKKEMEEARKIEQFILEYLKIDTYLGIDITKKKRTNFEVTFSINEDDMRIQADIYENILSLYSMKHPEADQNTVQSWISGKKNIVLKFGVTSDKSSYFIRDIGIENPQE